MRVTVLFFAKAREVAETNSTTVEFPGDAVDSSEVMQHLIDKWPQLREVMGTCVLAVNQEYVETGSAATIKDGDEVAIIPPLSGG
jgi:molybdopterin synthase sulfur carrier subunit